MPALAQLGANLRATKGLSRDENENPACCELVVAGSQMALPELGEL